MSVHDTEQVLVEAGRKRSFLARMVRLIPIFVAGCTAALLIATRNDPAIRLTVTEKILRWEKDSGSDLQVLKALAGIESSATVKELFHAIQSNDLGKLGVLLDVGISPDSEDDHNRSALRFAVENRSRDAINLLIARSAEINLVDRGGRAPLHSAIEANDIDLLLHLLVFGSDTNVLTADGISPLQMAMDQQNLPMVEVLLERGANPNLSGADGRSLLLYATEKDNPALVTALLRGGADVNQQDKEGKTALMHVVHRDDIAMVGVLLQGNVNLELVDKAGRTVASYAAETGGRVGPLFARGLSTTGGSGASNGEGTTRGSKSETPDAIASGKDLPSLPESNRSAGDPKDSEIIRVSKGSDRPSSDASDDGKPEGGSVSDRSSTRLTRIRLAQKIEGRWERSKKLTLRSVRILARNVGSYPAEDVLVKVRVPGGAVITLNGPTRLEPNATAEYLSDSSIDVMQTGNLKEELTCNNCHR